jgi:hypothetical protein
LLLHSSHSSLILLNSNQITTGYGLIKEVIQPPYVTALLTIPDAGKDHLWLTIMDHAAKQEIVKYWLVPSHLIGRGHISGSGLWDTIAKTLGFHGKWYKADVSAEPHSHSYYDKQLMIHYGLPLRRR